MDENAPDNQKPESQPAGQEYNKYIDPDYNKKQRKKKILLITGIIAAVLLIISAAVVIALSATSDNGSGTAEYPPASQICDDATCFEVNFYTCTPSEYTYQESDISSVKYKIQGSGEIGCSIEMSYVISKYLPDAQGKSMICDFDNTIDLDSAVQNIIDYPDDYGCQGELAEFFKNINNT